MSEDYSLICVIHADHINGQLSLTLPGGFQEDNSVYVSEEDQKQLYKILNRNLIMVFDPEAGRYTVTLKEAEAELSEEKKQINFMYWVSLGTPHDSLEYQTKDAISHGDCTPEYGKIVLGCAKEVHDTFGDLEVVGETWDSIELTHKTRSFEDAMAILMKLSEIFNKHYGDSQWNSYSDYKIYAQPRCEGCNHDGEMDDKRCPICGDELEQFRVIRPDDLVVKEAEAENFETQLETKDLDECEECGFPCFATNSCLRCGHPVKRRAGANGGRR